jgi:hypothetical protein
VHRAVRRAEANQQILLLGQCWRRTVAGTDAAGWRVEDAVFHAGDRAINRDARGLTVSEPERSRTIALPADTRCDFSVERHEDAADCAVMTVQWTARYFRRAVTNRVRLVACGDAAE